MKHRQRNRLSTLYDPIGLRPMRCLLSVFSIMVFINPGFAQETVSIGLMDGKDISSVLFSPTAGEYVLTNMDSDTVYRFRKDDAVSISRSGTSIVVKGVFGLSDTLNALHLLGNGTNPSFKVRFENDEKEHGYFGDLNVKCENGKLRIVNVVGVESYVARVVMAEVGYGAAEEYYRLQSIICRTYAVRNLKRHVDAGFNLCDHEHCQVYSGRKTATNEIVKAVAATSGLVMVSAENELILSAFHANCGGQTANCEDVWREPRSYLKSVTDTFCLASRSAEWSKSIAVDVFIAQLGFSVSAEEVEGFSFVAERRQKFFRMGQDSMEIKRPEAGETATRETRAAANTDTTDNADLSVGLSTRQKIIHTSETRSREQLVEVGKRPEAKETATRETRAAATFESDSIEMGKMRRMFRLRSAFFNVKIENGNVLFDGRGYGHGVGLCQQGAMKMAEHGYDHSQILGYYYKGVSLVSLEAIR